jgi:PAS domain S-box-containing protein
MHFRRLAILAYSQPLRTKPLLDLSSLSEQERNQLLVNAISDYAIYMLDANGHVASWNPGAERFKGYSADEVIGRHFQMFFTEEDRAADAPGRTLRVAARDDRYETEGWRVRKDGNRFWAHVIVDAIRTPQGDLLGFAKIVRDITDKKAGETDLRASEERFRLLVQGVKDCAIYMLDKNGVVTNWNLGAEHIKGYSSSEIVGQHFSRFYTEPDRAAGEPARALSTALNQGKYEKEAWRVRKDGSLFWAHVLIDPIYDDEGNHVGFAKVTRDRTEQKKAAEQVEEAQRNLLQSQKLQAIGELTGGIAHDFNNMLTVIAGSADFLRRNRAMPEEKKLRYLDGIIEITERATTLTNQLLSFARRQPVKPEVLDIGKRLGSARELLSRTLGSRIAVVVEVSRPGLTVEVDPGQLEASILNAAVNARDAMPHGGKITLAAQAEEIGREKFVRVSIADTGLGMPERVRERAFDPFFTTKEVGKGTGLGLSQIHGFAAQAGGFAEIESEEGAGTRVSLLLPISSKEPDEHVEVSHEVPDKFEARVLLVEDNEQVQAFTHEVLEDLGCTVLLANDASQALVLLETNSIDVVITDVVMPGMSGIELADEIGKRWSDVPVILATGYSDELLAKRPEYPSITKPFTSVHLREALGAVLQR